MNARDEQREIDMARRILDGETLEAVAQDYGLTRERVRQLVKRQGVTGQDGYAARMVERVCKVCGRAEFVVASRADRPACSKKCSIAQRGPSGPRRADGRTAPDGRGMSRHDGHWWVRAGRNGNGGIRAERHIAQLVLGRTLRRNEYVILIDGDPDNLDPTNIGITTPKQVAERRFGRPWTYTPLVNGRKDP